MSFRNLSPTFEVSTCMILNKKLWCTFLELSPSFTFFICWKCYLAWIYTCLFKYWRASAVKAVTEEFSNLLYNKEVSMATNCTAKGLRMRQVEHFRSLFQSHLPVRSKSPSRARLHSVCSLWFSCSASCCSCFDYFVVIEIAFMDNQAQITETISRLDSEKVRW